LIIHGLNNERTAFLNCPLFLELALVGVYFEGKVERAEGKDGSEREDHSQHQKHRSEGSSDDAAQGKVYKHGGNYEADNSIHIGHIAFHLIISPFCE